MFNFLKRKKKIQRVRNQNGMYARKVKIGGMYEGYFYMPSTKGVKYVGD